MAAVKKRALLSVSDKEGVLDFARALSALDFELMATGNTARTLKEAGLKVAEVSDYTGFPEILSGRVKTLHPAIHGGILAKRDDTSHMEALRELNIAPIDLVCVNLYPFAEAVKKPDCALVSALENIDIGGPAMIRSAAKNWPSVIVVTDPQDYPEVVAALNQDGKNELSESFLFRLAVKAFSHTAAYDGMISQYLSTLNPEKIALDAVPKQVLFPGVINEEWQEVRTLRYGENPHQQAALYQGLKPAPGSIAAARQLQGKELSYNNLADADAAWEAVKEFTSPACVIVKHANPCGVAVAESVLAAYQFAFATDKTSAFGGIIAFNRPVTGPVAKEMIASQFMEVVIAPEFSPEALTLMSHKKNVRLLEAALKPNHTLYDFKRINGGLLVQTRDQVKSPLSKFKVVSKRQPTKEETDDLLFLWQVAKYVKSNAVVFGRDKRTYGIGAGQMSRVDSTLIAARKAKEAGLDLRGAAAASDAFFPFRDGVDVIAEQGIKAVIHPGGSIRDEEVIRAADEHDMVMIFTGERHFRH